MSFELGSNMTCVSEVHLLKHNSGICSTCAGMQIDTNDEQSANAPFPTLASFEPDSNTNLDRDEHPLKQ
jgi:hypothetical protein